jgi:hypothetical protein
LIGIIVTQMGINDLPIRSMIVVEKSTGSEFVKIVGKIDKDIIEKWCKTNCESYFKLSKADENEKCYYVRFESTRDAALFKLFWG